MILSVGADIVQIPRIEKIFCSYGDCFLKKILSLPEIETFSSIASEQVKYQFLAKRFAAKEAISKAFGTGIGKYLNFTEITISNDRFGKPLVQVDNIHNKLAELGYIIVDAKIHISLSDDYPVVVAFAVIEIFV